MTQPPTFEVGLLTRCQRKTLRRKSILDALYVGLFWACETEETLLEQVLKLKDPEVRAAFQGYARIQKKARRGIEKAIRSRGGKV
jgi:hypothetical protein